MLIQKKKKRTENITNHSYSAVDKNIHLFKKNIIYKQVKIKCLSEKKVF